MARVARQPLRLWPETEEAIRAHAEAEAPNEACGLLGISAGIVHDFVPLRNAADKPEFAFEIDFSGFEPPVGDAVGIFHSHTHGSEHPSRSDIDRAERGWARDKLYLIYSTMTGRFAAWRIA